MKPPDQQIVLERYVVRDGHIVIEGPRPKLTFSELVAGFIWCGFAAIIGLSAGLLVYWYVGLLFSGLP